MTLQTERSMTADKALISPAATLITAFSMSSSRAGVVELQARNVPRPKK
jgi:hypothetical protein